MNGYENEYNFVLEFNNKRVEDLNPMLQDIVYSIFNNIKQHDLIKSWKNHIDQKTDIFLKIGNAIKGISIKMESRNSVHVESIKSFINFLSSHNVPKNIINEYLKFHYADNTIDNTGKKRLSTEEYKINNQESIDNINIYFNNKNIIFDAIDRFVLKGINSNYAIDAIILGTPKDFLWLSKNDIIDYLTNNIHYCSSPHFGELICQPLARCLNYNKKYELKRNYIQIKWYSLFDNILEQTNNNNVKKGGLSSNFQTDNVA